MSSLNYFALTYFILAGGNEFAEGGHGADSLNTNITCIQCNSESISERLSAKEG